MVSKGSSDTTVFWYLLLISHLQQPKPISCNSCNSRGHVECKWCGGTGFFILGDNMLCQVPSRNTSCVICAGKVTKTSGPNDDVGWKTQSEYCFRWKLVCRYLSSEGSSENCLSILSDLSESQFTICLSLLVTVEIYTVEHLRSTQITIPFDRDLLAVQTVREQDIEQSGWGRLRVPNRNVHIFKASELVILYIILFKFVYSKEVKWVQLLVLAFTDDSYVSAFFLQCWIRLHQQPLYFVRSVYSQMSIMRVSSEFCFGWDG